MKTSPTSRPSGSGKPYAMTSVSPRRPVARRFSRRIAGASSRLSSTVASCAPSHASTRRATRERRRSSAGFGLETRRDAATGLGIVDPVVVHAGEDANEFLFHFGDLLQRDGCVVELARVDLGAGDLLDRLLDFRGRQVVADPQAALAHIPDHRTL